MTFPFDYINGNYQVTILEDGTKIRKTPDNEFAPKRPETLDVNISNRCDNNCKYCYISATKDGKHGNLDLPIFDHIQPGTEIAINFANHPNLMNFLFRMNAKNVIVNMTVNQIDLQNDTKRQFIESLLEMGLLQGLGISAKDSNIPFMNSKNIVIHTIAGITNIQILNELIDQGHKILILGYKTKGRGIDFIPDLEPLKQEIGNMLEKNKSYISFDNLALEQLEIQKHIPINEWETRYMGEEGTFSMYLDTVLEVYHKSSTEEENFPIGDKSIIEIFKEVRCMR